MLSLASRFTDSALNICHKPAVQEILDTMYILQQLCGLNEPSNSTREQTMAEGLTNPTRYQLRG